MIGREAAALLPMRSDTVTQPSTRRTRLAATLRSGGLSGLAVALAHGARWRMGRLQNRVRARLEALQRARERRRIRRLNEIPTAGVDVANPQVAVIVTSKTNPNCSA